MSDKTHQGQADYFWDVQNSKRLGRYLTATELAYIDTALHDVKPGRVLDVGCGSGKLAFPLMNKGFNVVGVEYDRRPLRSFRGQDAGAALVNADAQTLPFTETSFTCVVAVELIDNLPNRSSFYRQAWRVLRPGGWLLVTLTNKHSLKGVFYGVYLRLTGRQRDAGFYEMDYNAGVAEITAVGFEIVSAWGYNWNLLPRGADNFLVDVFAAVERLLRLKHFPALSPVVFVVARKVS